jgi:hypothetical protein
MITTEGEYILILDQCFGLTWEPVNLPHSTSRMSVSPCKQVRSLLKPCAAFQTIWQLCRRRGTLEEIWQNQRLEHRPCAEASYVKRRVDQHLGIDRRYEISGIQADRWKLCPTRKWNSCYCRQSSLRCWRGLEIAIDGLI